MHTLYRAAIRVNQRLVGYSRMASPTLQRSGLPMQGVEADISYEQPYTQHPYGISALSIAIGGNGQSYPYIQAGFDANHATTGGATFPFYQIGYGPGNVDTVFLQVGRSSCIVSTTSSSTGSITTSTYG